MIQGEEVTVIVQGPVHGRPADSPAEQLTRRVLASVRHVWPAGELILSTWIGADVTGLDCDCVVLNEDPGAVPLNDSSLKHIQNNLNRQIVSTRGGLARATRKYAVKLRTDCLLLRPPDFSSLPEQSRQREYQLLDARVIALNVVSIHPLRRPVLFHLSDLFHAGLASDLRTLWNIPLAAEPGFTRYLKSTNRPPIDANPGLEVFMRCSPEQYVIEQLVRRKFPDFSLRYQAEGSVESLFLWLRLLANNFQVLTPSQAGVELPERILSKNPTTDIFFQPTDEPWLTIWTRPNVSRHTRWLTAARFRLLQHSFRARSVMRTLRNRIVARLIHATS
jgi:hypothetical protein